MGVVYFDDGHGCAHFGDDTQLMGGSRKGVTGKEGLEIVMKVFAIEQSRQEVLGGWSRWCWEFPGYQVEGGSQATGDDALRGYLSR